MCSCMTLMNICLKCLNCPPILLGSMSPENLLPTNFQLDEMLISVYITLYTCLVHFIEDVNINLYTCAYVCTVCTCVCMCVQFSIQTFKYICFICTPLNLCWAVFNCVSMWLPMGIYGILNICQLSQQVHPISQTTQL